MVDMLSHVPVSNIHDLKVVFDAMSTVTAEKNEVSPDTQVRNNCHVIVYL